jgi:glutaredoxin
MEITIYSTTTCSFCHTLTAWLDKNKIAYTKKMTDEDDAAMAEFVSVNDGMFAVPFTTIKDNSGNVTKITGYDQTKFKQVLGI